MGCGYLDGRSALADHKGPNQIFTVKTPTDATSTKQHEVNKTANGGITVKQEKWVAPNEGGFAGVVELPARASASPKQVLEVISQITSAKFVNRLGFAGRPTPS